MIKTFICPDCGATRRLTDDRESVECLECDGRAVVEGYDLERLKCPARFNWAGEAIKL